MSVRALRWLPAGDDVARSRSAGARAEKGAGYVRVHPPIIVVSSAYVTPKLEKDAPAVGADCFLPKPFLFDQLEAIVRQALA